MEVQVVVTLQVIELELTNLETIERAAVEAIATALSGEGGLSHMVDDVVEFRFSEASLFST